MYFSFLDFKFKSFGISSGFLSSICLSLDWNVGFVLCVSIIIQMISGIFLSFFYNMGMESCLTSKAFILKELEFGWVLSYFHMTGSHFMFFFMFLHIFKSFFYSVLIYSFVWFSGFILLFVFFAISFTGYCLVLGSLGFWAMIVIMGMFESVFGELVSFLFFSGVKEFSDLVMFKIFVYHFLVSFFSLLCMYFHLLMVHFGGSKYSLSGSSTSESLSFYSSFFYKDVCVFLMFFFIYFIFLMDVEFFFSVDNFVELNFFEVPEEINSEWYLSLVFIILKSVNKKSLGLCICGFYFFLFIMKCFKFIFGFSNMEWKCILFFIYFLIWSFMVFTLSKFGSSFFSVNFFLFLLMFIFMDFIFCFVLENNEFFSMFDF